MGKGCLLSKVVLRQRLSSVKGRLPSKVVFCQRLSSVDGRLPSKVVFRQRSSFVKVRLPFWSSSILVVFHFGRLPFWSSSILVPCHIAQRSYPTAQLNGPILPHSSTVLTVLPPPIWWPSSQLQKPLDAPPGLPFTENSRS